MCSGTSDGSSNSISLILYLPRADSRSSRAEDNLKRVLNNYLQGPYALQVVYLAERPELLETDQILAVPTLIRRDLDREYRVVGDFTDGEAVLAGIGVAAAVD